MKRRKTLKTLSALFAVAVLCAAISFGSTRSAMALDGPDSVPPLGVTVADSETLPPDDPEVTPYMMWFPPTVNQVVRLGIVGSEYYGPMYFPETADYPSDLLLIYGFFGYNLVTSMMDIYPFNAETGGVLEMQFPLDII